MLSSENLNANISSANGKSSDTAYCLEKNVPIPPKSIPGRPRSSKYPFKQMDVGDSFIVPKAVAKAAQAAAYKWARDNGWKITTRRQGNGTRIWRIE